MTMQQPELRRQASHYAAVRARLIGAPKRVMVKPEAKETRIAPKMVIADIIRMRAEGLAQAKIAEALGISRRAVRYYLGKREQA